MLITDKEKLQIQAKAAKEGLSKILNLYFKQLIIVPGDESKFEYLTGIPVEVVDLDIPNRGALIVEKKGSRSHKSFEESDNYGTHISLLLENKILGIINAQLTQSEWSSRWDNGAERIYYGLPVARKNEGK